MIRGHKIPLPEVSSDAGSAAAEPDTLPIAEAPSLKQNEREWHDEFYKAHALEAYPGTPEQFRHNFERLELTPFCEGGWSWWGDLRREIVEAAGDVRGLRILDYGCGYGQLGMYMALCGAEVRGFDLSREATNTANEVASRYGVSAQFEAMDAEDLSYPDEQFDLAIGFGVLHHVIKYPRAGSQLWRVLKPGARAMFHETLWDNPFINLARRFTTEGAHAGDAHLTERNIRQFSGQFSHVQLEKRHLVYMLKRFAKLPYPNPAADLKPHPWWRRVKALDSSILSVTGLRHYCGEVIVSLQK